MRNLAQNPKWVCQEWPNMDIIKRCFTDYMVNVNDIDAVKKMNVIDYFNFDNPVQWSFYDTSKIPPRFKNIESAKKDWGEPGYKEVTTVAKNIGNRERREYNMSVKEWTASINAYLHK
jgi:hypothetical protein